MWREDVIRTVEGMVNPMFNVELLQAREAEVARKLRHAHHTPELPPTVLASLAARVLNAMFKRSTRQRAVEQQRNVGRDADAVESS
jgi:hypothetical protein